MSAVFLFLAIPASAFAYSSPGQPTGYMNDFAHVLTADQDKAVEAKLAALHDATTDQVTVVTVPSLGGDSVENYAVKLFEDWKIGDRDTDNGLLVLIAIQDRKMKIETGYGLEGTVTDLQAGNIIRKVMTPAFKDGDYAAGINGGVDALSDILAGSPDAAQYSGPAGDPSDDSSSDGFGGSLGAIIFFGFIVINFLARILGRTRSWWLGGFLGAGAGIVIGFIWGIAIGIGSGIILAILGLVFDFIVSRGGGPGGRGGMGSVWPIFFGNRWGGGSGGGRGGGFGGFGGGSSGGGGASGSW